MRAREVRPRRGEQNPTAMNELLRKVICHNLTCLIQEQESLGIVPVFWNDEQEAANMVQTAAVAV